MHPRTLHISPRSGCRPLAGSARRTRRQRHARPRRCPSRAPLPSFTCANHAYHPAPGHHASSLRACPVELCWHTPVEGWRRAFPKRAAISPRAQVRSRRALCAPGVPVWWAQARLGRCGPSPPPMALNGRLVSAAVVGGWVAPYPAVAPASSARARPNRWAVAAARASPAQSRLVPAAACRLAALRGSAGASRRRGPLGVGLVVGLVGVAREGGRSSS